MRIRIVKPLPAPLMDGFNVRDLRVGQVYDADSIGGRTANYLIVAGYAIQVDADTEKLSDKNQPR